MGNLKKTIHSIQIHIHYHFESKGTPPSISHPNHSDSKGKNYNLLMLLILSILKNWRSISLLISALYSFILSLHN